MDNAARRSALTKLAVGVIASLVISLTPAVPHRAVAAVADHWEPATLTSTPTSSGDPSIFAAGPVTWPVPMRAARATHAFAAPPPEIGAAVGGVIGPAGGVVTSDDDQLSVRFPLGAVPDPVTVSIQRHAVPAWPSVPHAFYWVELSARNAHEEPVHRFAVPVQLTLHVPPGLLALLSVGELVPAQPEDVRWWQYDDERQEWLPQPAKYDVASSTLYVKLDHFSHGAAGSDPDAQPQTIGGLDGYATDLFTGWPIASFPFAIPPGTAGMAPDITLQYFGGTADTSEHVPAPQPTTQADFVGFGWSLDPGRVSRASNGVGFSLNLAGRSGSLRLNKAEATGQGATFDGRYHADPEHFAKIDHPWRAVSLPGPHAWVDITECIDAGERCFWQDDGYRSGTFGDMVTFSFSGTPITWDTQLGPDQGKADVFIDGTLWAQVDNYLAGAPGQLTATSRTFSGLASGAHTIVIAVSGQKSSAATAAHVFVRDFVVNGVTTLGTQLASSAWTAGWIADHWVATTTDGTQYRFGYDLPAEVYVYPQGPGLRTTTGSHQWELVPPGTTGTKLIRRGETYLLDQITDLRGNRITFAYTLSVADLSLAGSPLSSYARAAYLSDVRYTLHTTSPIAGQRRVQVDRQPRAIGTVQDYETDAEYDARVGAGASASTQRFFSDQRPLYLRADVCAATCADEASWTGAYKYAFTHGYLAATFTGAQSYRNRLLLTSVQPLDPGSADALPATTFQYSSPLAGALTVVSNGYGGDTVFDYTTYSAGGNAAYPYWRVTTMTRHSGITNGGAPGPEAFATTFAYGASTLLGTTPGHTSATATDPLGVIAHEFVATADARDATRPGLRGRETKTTVKTAGGTVVDETIRTYGLRRSSRALDPTSGADTASESDFIELRAVEHWSSENAAKQVTRTEYAYDPYGNLVRSAERGDTATSADDRTTASTMLPNAGIWLVDRPQATTLYQHAAPTAVEITGTGQPAQDGGMSWCAWWYQSFTAPATGVVKLVQPYLYWSNVTVPSGTAATLNMRVYADSGGVPGALLGSTSAPTATLPPSTGTVPTPFDLDVSADGTLAWSAAVRVIGGQLYWVALQVPTAGTLGYDISWVGTTANTYTRGSALARNAAGTTCQMPTWGDPIEHTAPMPADLAMQVSVLPDLGDAATPAVAQTQLAYDGQSYGTAPTQGLPTWIQRLDAQTPSTKEIDLHSYDASGDRTQTISLYDPATSTSSDARNPRTDWTYDAAYRTFATTTALRAKDLGGGSFLTLSTQRIFDARSGGLSSVTDPSGATTTYGYDAFYRLKSLRRPGDETGSATQTFDYFYGSAPNRLVVTSKDGSVATDGGLHSVLFYDGLGRLIETKREMADNTGGTGKHSVVRRLYTDRGLPQKEFAPWATPAQSSSDFLSHFENVESVSPAQPSTLYAYDPASRSTQRTGTDGALATRAYGDGVVTSLDPLNRQTKRYQDGYGRLAKVEEYTGTSPYTLYATTTYAYSFQDLLTQITDNAAKNTAYTYDGLGRRRTQSDPDSGAWTYGYDGLGRILTWTDAKGQRIDLAYDNASRPVLRSGTPPGGSPTTLATFTYDAGANGLGRRSTLVDPSGSTSYSYDSRGRVTQLAQTILGSAYTTAFSYDSLDRGATITYPDNEVVTTTYGANGLPSSLAGTSTYVPAATYTALFQPLQISYGSGSVASFDYYDTPNKTDHAGAPQPADFRLRRISYQASGGAVRQQHDYRYDRAGNVTKWWQQDEVELTRFRGHLECAA